MPEAIRACFGQRLRARRRFPLDIRRLKDGLAQRLHVRADHVQRQLASLTIDIKEWGI